MINHRLISAPLDAIKVRRDERQRRVIDAEHVKELANSFAERGLISPIIVRDLGNGQFDLAAGECRLSGWQHNRRLGVPCPKESYKDWSKIPAFAVAASATDEEIFELEYIENAQRRSLGWKDDAHALRRIHMMRKAIDPNWTYEATGRIVGKTTQHIKRTILVAEAMTSNTDSVLAKQLNECDGLRSAILLMERHQQRARESILDGLGLENAISPMPSYAPPRPSAAPISQQVESSAESDNAPEPVKGCSPVISYEPAEDPYQLNHAEFGDFAAAYDGPLFNFVMLDPPYGVDLFDSPGMSVRKDLTSNPYSDSVVDFWHVLETLATFQGRLLATECHIMLWYNPPLREEIAEFFSTNFLGAAVQAFPMLWFKSDHVGIVPDSARYGRRNYETAMLISLGDRKIVRPTSLCIPHRGKWSTKVHRSEKPFDMLRYFFKMFVDTTTRMLDPTCGSGTSVAAAVAAGASFAVGIERDETAYATATKHVPDLLAWAEAPEESVIDGLDLGL